MVLIPYLERALTIFSSEDRMGLSPFFISNSSFLFKYTFKDAEVMLVLKSPLEISYDFSLVIVNFASNRFESPIYQLKTACHY